MPFLWVPVNSYPNQVVPCQLVPKLTILSYCCYVMYHTNRNTAHFFPSPAFPSLSPSLPSYIPFPYE